MGKFRPRSRFVCFQSFETWSYSEYIVLTICLLIGLEPSVNFFQTRANYKYLLLVNGLVTNLYVVRANYDFQEQCQTAFRVMIVVIFFKTIYNNKAISRLGFSYILNYQGKCYQPRLTSTLIFPDITKISSNNC